MSGVVNLRHDNVEHEVIAAIISSLGPHYGRYQSTALCPGSPKMKLRYLKLLYPEADEAVLFDLLYNCDQNAMDAITRLEAMGYKRSASAKTAQTEPKTSSKAVRPQSAPFASKTSQFPPNTTEKQRSIELDIFGVEFILILNPTVFKKLEELFPTVSRTLINMALESSGFNEERARVFLSAMTPQDSDKYLPTEFKSVSTSNFISGYCRGTQTNSLVHSFTGTPIKTAKTTANKYHIP